MLQRLKRRVGTASWIAGSACLLLALMALASWSLISLRRDAMHAAAASNANLVQALQQDIGRTVATFDLSVKFFGTLLALPGTDLTGPGAGAAALFGGFSGPSFLSSLLVADANGHIRTSNLDPNGSSVDLSQRDYFSVQRDRTDAGLYISQPFKSKKSGAPMVAISRRLSAPDGRFAGVLAATLRLDYFADLAERFHLGPGAVMLLARTDGTLLARVPAVEGSLNARIGGDLLAALANKATVSLEAVSSIDRQQRLYSLARVEGLPLIVGVGVATRAIYADWVHRASVIGPVLLLLTLLVAGLLTVLATLRLELARRRTAERAARRGDAIYRLIAENSNDVVTCLDADGINLYVSPAIEDLLGVTADDLIGRPFLERVHPQDQDNARAVLCDLRARGERATLTYRCTERTGREIWLETSFRQLRNPQTNAPEEIVGTTRDITGRKLVTDALRSKADALAVMAATDGLTGLGNRRAFDQVLEAEWLRARRDGSSLALLMVDVDFFKAYNDAYGHLAGDDVLRTVGSVIGEHARRPADFPARYGGEEFALVLPVTELEGAVLVAEDIRRSLAALAMVHDASPSRRVSVSIGVAAAIGEITGRGESLVQAADAALYNAKRLGRDRTETTPLVRARG